MNKVAYLLVHEDVDELPESASEKLRMILDSTQELEDLIDKLLEFSRLNRAALKRRLLNPARLAREALRTLQEEREGRDVLIALDNMPPCLADRALLKQVYLNLLANALKFTRKCEHAEIQIGHRRDNGETIYFVRDNGVGLDTSRPDSIFKSFRRLRNAQGFEGSGIGLALVKRIIDHHDGRIWAEGEAGRGAAIFFTLGESASEIEGFAPQKEQRAEMRARGVMATPE